MEFEFEPGQVWIGRGTAPEHRKVVAVRDGLVSYVMRTGSAGRFSSFVQSAKAAAFKQGGFKRKARGAEA